jgi:hypothetical protein
MRILNGQWYSIDTLWCNLKHSWEFFALQREKLHLSRPKKIVTHFNVHKVGYNPSKSVHICNSNNAYYGHLLGSGMYVTCTSYELEPFLSTEPLHFCNRKLNYVELFIINLLCKVQSLLLARREYYIPCRSGDLQIPLFPDTNSL